ncbi:MAG: glycosyltransferase family 4 protein [Bacteroidales bacterium]|nr:glycosyltransferase family 4 protein [Bacteroidales bacterium]
MKLQKRNRITICASFIRPIISGDGDSALTFAEALEKKGSKISIVSLNPYAKLPFKSKSGSIKIYRSAYFNNSLIGKILSRLAFIIVISIISTTSDTVLVYGRMLSYKYSIIISKLFGKKVVFRSTLLDFDDVHTLISKKGIEGLINKWIFQKIDVYFATTPAFTNRWISAGLPINKVFQSTQGVNIGIFKPASTNEKKEIRNHLQIPNNQLIICSIGDLCYRKGYAEILESLKRIEEQFTYIVLGAKQPKKGLWGQKANDKEMLKIRTSLESELKERIKLLGLVHNPEDYLKAADIFVHFSETEGLSNAMLQAMACGIPMVVRPIESLPNYLLFDNKNCIFAHNDDELSKSIVNLMNSESLRNSIGRNAYESSLKMIDVSLIADNFLKCRS